MLTESGLNTNTVLQPLALYDVQQITHQSHLTLHNPSVGFSDESDFSTLESTATSGPVTSCGGSTFRTDSKVTACQTHLSKFTLRGKTVRDESTLK